MLTVGHIVKFDVGRIVRNDDRLDALAADDLVVNGSGIWTDGVDLNDLRCFADVTNRVGRLDRDIRRIVARADFVCVKGHFPRSVTANGGHTGNAVKGDKNRRTHLNRARQGDAILKLVSVCDVVGFGRISGQRIHDCINAHGVRDGADVARRVGRTGHDGRGVFAARNFASGELNVPLTVRPRIDGFRHSAAARSKGHDDLGQRLDRAVDVEPVRGFVAADHVVAFELNRSKRVVHDLSVDMDRVRYGFGVTRRIGDRRRDIGVIGACRDFRCEELGRPSACRIGNNSVCGAAKGHSDRQTRCRGACDDNAVSHFDRIHNVVDFNRCRGQRQITCHGINANAFRNLARVACGIRRGDHQRGVVFTYSQGARRIGHSPAAVCRNGRRQRHTAKADRNGRASFDHTARGDRLALFREVDHTVTAHLTVGMGQCVDEGVERHGTRGGFHVARPIRCNGFHREGRLDRWKLAGDPRCGP